MLGKGKKIDRSFMIDHTVNCICNITKEYIITCLVANYHGIFVGYDALKKLNDYIRHNLRNVLTDKKFPEVNLAIKILFKLEFEIEL